MSTAVQHVFNTTAASYDPDRAKLIPGFDRFYAVAIAQVPAAAKYIVDVGAGTGLLSAFLRDRFPHAHLHLMDNSEPMLARARERFAGDVNVTFTLADYTAAPLPALDAVTSALSIHHLDDAAKQTLFARIYAALPPGGVFVNAEQVLAATPTLEARAKQQWLADIRALGATEPQIEASLFRQQEDRCATVEDQLRWLRAAGFTGVDCPYRDSRFAVLTATRA